jgi:hypothetical protein
MVNCTLCTGACMPRVCAAAAKLKTRMVFLFLIAAAFNLCAHV